MTHAVTLRWKQHKDNRSRLFAQVVWWAGNRCRNTSFSVSQHGQYSVRAWTDDAAPVMVDETVFTPDESQRQFAMREAITRAAAAIGSAHEAQ